MLNDINIEINVAINLLLKPTFFKKNCSALNSETINLLLGEFLHEYSVKIKREAKIKSWIDTLLSSGYTYNEIIDLTKKTLKINSVIPIYSVIEISDNDIVALNNIYIAKQAMLTLNSAQLLPLITALKKINISYP